MKHWWNPFIIYKKWMMKQWIRINGGQTWKNECEWMMRDWARINDDGMNERADDRLNQWINHYAYESQKDIV